MTLDEFRATLGQPTHPELPGSLAALWHDAKGDWEAAHRIAQGIDTRDAAWVHAYLHRKEGDLSNARYWYGRANKPIASDVLGAEWKRIVTELLERWLDQKAG